MLFLNPAHLPKGPLMGVDPGSKTLGIAVCNSARTVVTPLTTIQRVKFSDDVKELLRLYDERQCKGLVVGLPLHMEGGEGRRAQSARSFVTNLLRIRDLPVTYQDERLSTFGAAERLLEAGVKHADHKARIDAEAAAIILASAIDRIEQASGDGPS